MASTLKVLLTSVCTFAFFVGCGGGGSTATTAATTTTTSTATTTTTSTTTSTTLAPQVTLRTNYGDIVVELNPSKAPVTVSNFLQYVADDFYTNKIFHRVISNFVIQGGGFNASLEQAAVRAPIVLESNNGLSNLRGTIAMARTAAADSATSQFYINVVDNTSLDGTGAGTGYAVFGTVVAGMDVVDLIKAVPTTTVGAYTNVPLAPVLINSAIKTQ